MAIPTKKKKPAKKTPAKKAPAKHADFQEVEYTKQVDLTNAPKMSDFEQVPDGFAAAWAPKAKGDNIMGCLIGCKAVEITRGKKVEFNRLGTFTAPDGSVFSVWDSARVSIVFDNIDIALGCWFHFEYNGTVKVKGGNMKDITVKGDKAFIAALKSKKVK